MSYFGFSKHDFRKRPPLSYFGSSKHDFQKRPQLSYFGSSKHDFRKRPPLSDFGTSKHDFWKRPRLSDSNIKREQIRFSEATTFYWFREKTFQIRLSEATPIVVFQFSSGLSNEFKDVDVPFQQAPLGTSSSRLQRKNIC